MDWRTPAVEETPVGLEASGYFSPDEASIGKPMTECPGQTQDD